MKLTKAVSYRVGQFWSLFPRMSAACARRFFLIGEYDQVVFENGDIASRETIQKGLRT